ncbi:MAG: hypothetical protein HY233_02560 [Acidobacteriales bacterium]|nr:hypothetical protein [Terriglobales bacterium]
MTLRLASLALALCLAATAQVQHKPSTPPVSRPAESAETLYRNTAFGFRYRIPYGWVERTKEMQEGNEAAKGEVLLAIFERPPQAAGETINSAVVIAAESAVSYPGLKKAEDYLGPLTELTTSKGFKAGGDPSEVEIDTQRLVRADFSKPLNEKLTMHQSTLVLLAKGQIVSFTFLADNDDAVNDLIDRLSFSALKSKAK